MNSTSQASRYYPALDGFRAFAVLMVFSTHYLGTSLPGIRNWGLAGVDFFFVLSGFLITGILYDSRNREHSIRDFYVRRVLRIFPLYYAVWLALLLLWPVFHWRWDREWVLWPIHLGNLGRFIFFRPSDVLHMDVVWSTRHLSLGKGAYIGHFWSLCVEEQFYLFWPMIVLFVRSRRKLIAITCTVIVLEPLFRLVLLHLLPADLINADFLWRFTLTRLDGLMLGSLIALVLRGSRADWLHRYGRALTFGSIALAFLVFLEYAHRMHTNLLSVTDYRFSTLGISAIDLLGAGILIELIREESMIGRMASWRPARRLGQVSYGFYIFHDLPHDLYYDIGRHLWRPGLSTAVIALVCTTAISFLSYRYFETPFLRLKSRFSSQTHRAPEI